MGLLRENALQTPNNKIGMINGSILSKKVCSFIALVSLDTKSACDADVKDTQPTKNKK